MATSTVRVLDKNYEVSTDSDGKNKSVYFDKNTVVSLTELFAIATAIFPNVPTDQLVIGGDYDASLSLEKR